MDKPTEYGKWKYFLHDIIIHDQHNCQANNEEQEAIYVKPQNDHEFKVIAKKYIEEINDFLFTIDRDQSLFLNDHVLVSHRRYHFSKFIKYMASLGRQLIRNIKL